MDMEVSVNWGGQAARVIPDTSWNLLSEVSRAGLMSKWPIEPTFADLPEERKEKLLSFMPKLAANTISEYYIWEASTRKEEMREKLLYLTLWRAFEVARQLGIVVDMISEDYNIIMHTAYLVSIL